MEAKWREFSESNPFSKDSKEEEEDDEDDDDKENGEDNNTGYNRHLIVLFACLFKQLLCFIFVCLSFETLIQFFIIL